MARQQVEGQFSAEDHRQRIERVQPADVHQREAGVAERPGQQQHEDVQAHLHEDQYADRQVAVRQQVFVQEPHVHRDVANY